MAIRENSKKKFEEESPSANFFIFLVVACVVFAIGSMVFLQSDPWVQSQKLWLISRSAAITSYIVLTVIIMLGIILSHPKNKTTWRLTRYLLPWHQALIVALFSLLFIHLFYTATDEKSGIAWHDLAFPIHSKYHPWAMVAGASGMYLLLLVSITASLRKWIKKWWLPTHRVSWLIWVLVFLHGIYGGSDAVELAPMYKGSGIVVMLLLLWRLWSGSNSLKAAKTSETLQSTVETHVRKEA